MYTLQKLANELFGGNLQAAAKALNDAGHMPRLDEADPNPQAEMDIEAVINLYAMRAGDRVGRKLGTLLDLEMR